MQVQRLFEIVYLLMNQKTTTARLLAERFQVSVRTILRDIDILSAAGIPICTTQGKGGGISLMEHYVLNKTVLTEDEQNQILFALQSVSATGYSSSAGVAKRLQSLFNKVDVDWMEVDFTRWGNGATDKKKFDLLKQALIQNHALAFLYSSCQGHTSARCIYPLKLAYKGQAWYLQGYCLSRKDYRTFKINRMQDLRVLEETFQRAEYAPPPVDAPGTPLPSLAQITLQFAPSLAFRVYDEFDHSLLQEQPDGNLLVTTFLPQDEWLCQFLLSFGAGVEVLSPPDLRVEMVRQTSEIQKIYQPNET